MVLRLVSYSPQSGVFLPDASASSASCEFYVRITSGAWFLEEAREAAVSDVNFAVGALQLTFINVTRIMSWSIIYGSVQNLKMRTGMGMAGRCNAFLSQ